MEQDPQIFESLNDVSDADSARVDIISYIKSFLPYFEEISDGTFEAAYSIAGLMATDYARSLEANDPIDGILTIAGELEIKPENSKDLTLEIAAKIKQL